MYTNATSWLTLNKHCHLPKQFALTSNEDDVSVCVLGRGGGGGGR